jgi:hypothetical protein
MTYNINWEQNLSFNMWNSFLQYMFNHIDGVRKAMIVDFDAHQGNGHERDFLGDERVFILDMYNRLIYPGDNFAKQAIKRKVELNHHTTDQVYLENIRRRELAPFLSSVTRRTLLRKTSFSKGLYIGLKTDITVSGCGSCFEEFSPHCI